MKRVFLATAGALGFICAFWPRSVVSHEVVSTTVTYDREIVRIVNKKCIACHSENNLGIPLTTYEQTRPWARSIEEEVLRTHMPPWRAVAGYGQFANDIGLTNRELQFLVAWVEGNGPKTKEDRLIVNFDKRQTLEAERLRPDFGKWQLGPPDLPKPLQPTLIRAGQPDEIRQMVVDLGLGADRWIRALEFKPGDRRVIRAAFFTLQETGQWIGSWTPWYGATTFPPDTAYPVGAGSHIVAEIHYRGANQAVTDQSTLGVYFALEAPAHSAADLVLDAKRTGPAGSAAQKFSATMRLATDVNVFSLRPELQPGLESVEVSARKPDGTVQVLLLLRDVLGEWPTPYVLSQPVGLPKNTELSVTDYYVGSAAMEPPGSLKLIVGLYAAPSSGLSGPPAR